MFEEKAIQKVLLVLGLFASILAVLNGWELCGPGQWR
jgi:hypothetical protein